MKNVLLISLVSLSLFAGCVEEKIGEETTLPSNNQPNIPDEPPSPAPPYTREIMPSVSTVDDLSDLALWDYTTTGSSLNLTVSGSTISYSSPSKFDGNGVTVESKFKTTGDLNNSGAFSISSNLAYAANGDTQTVIFFDFSTNLSTVL